VSLFSLRKSECMDLIKPVVLASKSPRRATLLQQIGIQPIIVAVDIEEVFDEEESPARNALRLSMRKARSVEPEVENGIIIGADTIVVLDGQMLGKPLDKSDAHRMLRMLSGRTHDVITAFALVDRPSGKWTAAYEETRVTFRSLPDEEIWEYIESGSPMDKAGAYGIQDDYGAVFVTRIEGCWYNVVGFPLAKFYTTLQEFQHHLIHHLD